MRELHPELLHQPTITLDSVLDRDLGLDSMARMELLARIEKSLEVHLPEQAFTTAETPRDIVRSLEKFKSPKIDQWSGDQIISSQTATFISKAHEVQTLTELLISHAKALPDQIHITIEEFRSSEKTLTFAELYSGARRMAAGLQQHDLNPGDTVAIMLPTSVDYFYSFFAILLTGCVPVPLYPPTRPSQIEEHLLRHNRILKNARAKMLITIPEVTLIGRLLQAQIDTLNAIVTAEDLTIDGRECILIPHNGKDIAFLQYTSGSTGDPKGVILTHDNLLANIRVMGQSINASAGDVFVSWLPLYHDMGLIGAWLGSLYYGCRLVVMSPLAFLARPERWLWAIHKHRGTLSASPNFGYEVSCRRIEDKSIEGLDLSSWRLAFNGAEPVSSQTITKFSQRFEPYGFRSEAVAPVYGLAEASVGLAFPPLNREPVIDYIQRDHFIRTGQALSVQAEEEVFEFVACGQPLAGHQIRVVDSQGRELPERHQGRLEFKGPSATSGYLHNPDKTRSLFNGDWLDSGDLAYIADGDIYIISRVKDIIIRGGRNIYPHELEEAIGNIEGIRKGCVAIFGLQDRDERTERVVVLAETRIMEPEARSQLHQSITHVGVDLLGIPPEEIVLVPPGSVLKTSSGKIRRSATRELFERGLIGKKKRPVWLQVVHMTLAGILPFIRQSSLRLGNYLYASYCWILYGLLGLPLWLVATIIPSQKICWSLCHHCGRLLAFLTGTKIEIRGMEHLANASAKVLVSNHMSYMDALILTTAMPVPCSFVGKAELASNKALKIPLDHLDTVFVERFDAQQGVEDTKKISQLVGAGKRILFFAEGTLQRMPGLLPFQMGAFLTAARNTTGVIPITIRGTRNKLRSGSWFPRKGSVRIIFSPVMLAKGEDWNAALELRNAVRSEILQQLGEPDLSGEYSSLSQMEIKRSEKEGG